MNNQARRVISYYQSSLSFIPAFKFITSSFVHDHNKLHEDHRITHFTFMLCNKLLGNSPTNVTKKPLGKFVELLQRQLR